MSRIEKNVLISIAAVLTALTAPAATSRPGLEQPNIILVYADDLGIGMLGCYGQEVVSTPHIDKLAEEGMRFTNYYGGTYCAPARFTLMTGLHDGRMGGWDHNKAGLPIRRDAGEITEEQYHSLMDEVKKNSYQVSPQEVFLGQVGQAAGYTTAQFGKLNWGFLTWAERVERFGWDYHEGYYDHVRCHGFYPPYLWRNGVRFELPGNHMPDCGKTTEEGNEPVGYGGETYSQEVFINSILQFIREHQDEPFFIYHPTQLPHGPVAIPELHPDFADDPNLSLAEKKYASMVKMLDDHVGLIMKELKKLGLDQKTMVLFTSDNGHEMYYGPKPTFRRQVLADGKKADLEDRKWRTSEIGDVFNGSGGRAGLKRSGFQGGIQCPMIVRWPGKVAPGTETNLLASHYDFMATLADIGGIESPHGKDGFSYLPTLLGLPQNKQHDVVVVKNLFDRMGKSALIDRDGWKVIEVDRDKDAFQLYNILSDNEERHNLADRYPEKLKLLKSRLLSELDSERRDL